MSESNPATPNGGRETPGSTAGPSNFLESLTSKIHGGSAIGNSAAEVHRIRSELSGQVQAASSRYEMQLKQVHARLAALQQELKPRVQVVERQQGFTQKQLDELRQRVQKLATEDVSALQHQYDQLGVRFDRFMRAEVESKLKPMHDAIRHARLRLDELDSTSVSGFKKVNDYAAALSLRLKETREGAQAQEESLEDQLDTLAPRIDSLERAFGALSAPAESHPGERTVATPAQLSLRLKAAQDDFAQFRTEAMPAMIQESAATFVDAAQQVEQFCHYKLTSLRSSVSVVACGNEVVEQQRRQEEEVLDRLMKAGFEVKNRMEALENDTVTKVTVLEQSLESTANGLLAQIADVSAGASHQGDEAQRHVEGQVSEAKVKIDELVGKLRKHVGAAGQANLDAQNEALARVSVIRNQLVGDGNAVGRTEAFEERMEWVVGEIQKIDEERVHAQERNGGPQNIANRMANIEERLAACDERLRALEVEKPFVGVKKEKKVKRENEKKFEFDDDIRRRDQEEYVTPYEEGYQETYVPEIRETSEDDKPDFDVPIKVRKSEEEEENEEFDAPIQVRKFEEEEEDREFDAPMKVRSFEEEQQNEELEVPIEVRKSGEEEENREFDVPIKVRSFEEEEQNEGFEAAIKAKRFEEEEQAQEVFHSDGMRISEEEDKPELEEQKIEEQESAVIEPSLEVQEDATISEVAKVEESTSKVVSKKGNVRKERTGPAKKVVSREISEQPKPSVSDAKLKSGRPEQVKAPSTKEPEKKAKPSVSEVIRNRRASLRHEDRPLIAKEHIPEEEQTIETENKPVQEEVAGEKSINRSVSGPIEQKKPTKKEIRAVASADLKVPPGENAHDEASSASPKKRRNSFRQEEIASKEKPLKEPVSESPKKRRNSFRQEVAPTEEQAVGGPRKKPKSSRKEEESDISMKVSVSGEKPKAKKQEEVRASEVNSSQEEQPLNGKQRRKSFRQEEKVVPKERTVKPAASEVAKKTGKDATAAPEEKAPAKKESLAVNKKQKNLTQGEEAEPKQVKGSVSEGLKKQGKNVRQEEAKDKEIDLPEEKKPLKPSEPAKKRKNVKQEEKPQPEEKPHVESEPPKKKSVRQEEKPPVENELPKKRKSAKPEENEPPKAPEPQKKRKSVKPEENPPVESETSPAPEPQKKRKSVKQEENPPVESEPPKKRKSARQEEKMKSEEKPPVEPEPSPAPEPPKKRKSARQEEKPKPVEEEPPKPSDAGNEKRKKRPGDRPELAENASTQTDEEIASEAPRRKRRVKKHESQPPADTDQTPNPDKEPSSEALHRRRKATKPEEIVTIPTQDLQNKLLSHADNPEENKMVPMKSLQGALFSGGDPEPNPPASDEPPKKKRVRRKKTEM